jgi:hypothetical protein
MAFAISKENSSDDKLNIRKVQVLTLADASLFSEGGAISGDGVAGNDGVGEIIRKIGNQLQVSITSGTFVNANAVDNVAVYAAPKTTISSEDDLYWEAVRERKNRQITTFFLLLDYIKNSGNLEIEMLFVDTRQSDKAFHVMKKDMSSGIFSIDQGIVNASGSVQIVANPGKNFEYVIFRIRPTVPGGTDVLTVAVAENNFSG